VPILEVCRDQPPPLPSEYLLNYFNRNDLRWAIAQMGGRENASHLLGGAKIIPGRWKEAMELEEVKYLLHRMEEYDEYNPQETESEQIREIRTQQSRGLMHTGSTHNDASANTNSTANLKLASLVSSSKSLSSMEMRRKEFWSKEKAIRELYQYLESYRKYKQRPAVWMPQLAELSHEGYSKLFNACSRFNSLPCVSIFSSFQNQDDEIHTVAGLVPFREWRFFESQLQLFIELQNYLVLHHNGSEDLFPDPSQVLMRGHKQLHELIRIHGGKTLLAQKLDMKFAWDVNHLEAGNSTRTILSSNSKNYLSWGPFALDFAVQLLHFIRSQYLSLNPPLSSSFISMPSEKDLLRYGHDDLARQVIRYGGYENVARRLGLAYFDGKSQWMEASRFKGAKLLWREKYSMKILPNPSTSSTTNMDERKRQGLAWDEDLVIKELHAYVKVNMTKRSLTPRVMPRLRHLDEDERGDLKRAISKFGGVSYICNKAGLISIEEWLTTNG